MRSNQTTTRMWIGGGDNQASNPHDWSDPNGLPGAPRPGDTLILNNGTINISDNDLKGDTLTLAGEGPTINLDNAHLRLQGSTAQQQGVSFTLNAGGDDLLNMISSDNSGILVVPTIHLAENAHLLMKGDLQFASYSINGGTGSEIINDGTIGAGRLISQPINTNVSGHGSIKVSGATKGPNVLTVNGKVGHGQTFELVNSNFGATLDVKQPDVFHGLLDVPSFETPHTSVILEGLVATNYSVKGDRLFLYEGNRKIDTVRLSNPTVQPVSIAQSGSSVILGFNETPPGTILPMNG